MDIEIAKSANVASICEVASKLGLDKSIINYGYDKAKINVLDIEKNNNSKLILVTSINPTPYGEGKTTVSIGINDALWKIGKKSVAVLREPSLGPVFGVKGGATGGGYSQVVPMEDINLHFTGDIHAVTTANNLLSSVIDNHIYFGNKLNIDKDKILFRRCLDVNDRALRNINLSNRFEKFNITAASEIMSILCLANDISDLRVRLSNMLIAFSIDNKPIFVKDLGVVGSLLVILKDAIKPNLVQTLENNPVIIHGGPFANIAHGCNSVIATKLGLGVSDYVITEAGFGSDLGAVKFFDIKCRQAGFQPNCVVIVVTLKALKHNAGVSNECINIKSTSSVLNGCSNLGFHIENMLKYTSNVIVTLNKYSTDTDEEIDCVKKFVSSYGVFFNINNCYSYGGDGAIDLARDIVEVCNRNVDFKFFYDDNLSLLEKIDYLLVNMYHAKNINYNDDVLEKINRLEGLGYGSLPICIAKTQYSISANPKLLGNPIDYDVDVKDISVYTGAGFIVVYLGNIITMPGLNSKSNYLNIDMDNDYNITGLF